MTCTPLAQCTAAFMSSLFLRLALCCLAQRACVLSSPSCFTWSEWRRCNGWSALRFSARCLTVAKVRA
jgi:hypothetical protein